MEFDEGHILAALQDEVAARVLQACIAKASSAKEIRAATEIPLVTVYRHIKRLQRQGLLHVERSAMTTTGKPYDLYRCALEWAGIAIHANGLKVHWKTPHSMSDRLYGLWKQLEQRK